ncbi:Uncharacterized protein FWK35_00027605 [Aphis craccivora]|uniref:Uncharacterized protein n=1 Tax=Aphis craccivora TaxID=307492 RepID=A0A6G0XJ76_APHCR|nr:Uncharacterized protein FWK35_00027605 [Aphis craccivora]
MKFLFKLINGFINCPEILSSLNFYVAHSLNEVLGQPLCFICLHIKPIMLQLHTSPMNRIISISDDINVDLVFYSLLSLLFCTRWMDNKPYSHIGIRRKYLYSKILKHQLPKSCNLNRAARGS